MELIKIDAAEPSGNLFDPAMQKREVELGNGESGAFRYGKRSPESIV
jgi:hypothetical protein